MDTVWSGPVGGPGWFDKTKIPDLVHHCLSRSQLKDVILLKRCNPDVEVSKLVALVAILEEDCTYATTLIQYGVKPPDRITSAEETEFSRLDRVELERIVLSFI